MTDTKLLAIIGIYLAACEILEFVTVRPHGAEAFPPKLGWRLLRWLTLGVGLFAIVELVYKRPSRSDDIPVWLACVFLLMGALWPRTVSVDSDGISSCSTFGLLRRHIPWSLVEKVDCDWEEVSAARLGFRFMGTRIEVSGRNGVQINHGVTQSRQAKFLDALRKHIPKEVFAPGLYDWRPS